MVLAPCMTMLAKTSEFNTNDIQYSFPISFGALVSDVCNGWVRALVEDLTDLHRLFCHALQFLMFFLLLALLAWRDGTFAPCKILLCFLLLLAKCHRLQSEQSRSLLRKPCLPNLPKLDHLVQISPRGQLRQSILRPR